MKECPTPNTLKQLLDECASPGQRDELSRHVETCATCQQVLESMLQEEDDNLFGESSIGHVLQREFAVCAGEDELSSDSSSGMRELITGVQSSSWSQINDSSVPNRSSTKDDWSDGSLPEIAGFRLVEWIGGGSSGVVFKAIDETLNRTVAIKLLDGPLNIRSDASARAWREARSSAMLKHENIVGLYRIGGEESSRPYLVLEFVEGQSLRELLDSDGHFSAERTATVIHDVCSGVHAAHEQNLIHRDLKPSNVLIESESQRARLVDFGLALDPDSADRLTREGWLAGTPAYMSPEQLRDSNAVDARSDVYSIGVMMYELLTGEVPFRGLAKSTLDRIIHETPQSPRLLNRSIPKDLETICLKAIAKEPAQRYQSAENLAEDVQRFRQGEPIQARPVSTMQRVFRWSRRNPLLATLWMMVATLLIAVSAGSIWSAMYFSHANKQLAIAKTESDRSGRLASRQRDVLLKTVEDLVYDVSDTSEQEVLDQDYLQTGVLRVALKGLKGIASADEDRLTTESAADAEEYRERIARRTDPNRVARNRAEILVRLAKVLVRVDEYDEARRYANQAEQIAEALPNSANDTELIALRANVKWTQGEIQFDLDSNQEALITCERAAELSEQILTPESENQTCEFVTRVVEGYQMFGYLLVEENRYDSATRKFKRATEHLDALKSRYEPPNPQGVISETTLGILDLESSVREALALSLMLSGEEQASAEEDLKIDAVDRLITAYQTGSYLLSDAIAEGTSSLDASWEYLTRRIKRLPVDESVNVTQLKRAIECNDELAATAIEQDNLAEAIHHARTSLLLKRRVVEAEPEDLFNRLAVGESMLQIAGLLKSLPIDFNDERIVRSERAANLAEASCLLTNARELVETLELSDDFDIRQRNKLMLIHTQLMDQPDPHQIGNRSR